MRCIECNVPLSKEEEKNGRCDDCIQIAREATEQRKTIVDEIVDEVINKLCNEYGVEPDRAREITVEAIQPLLSTAQETEDYLENLADEKYHELRDEHGAAGVRRMFGGKE